MYTYLPAASIVHVTAMYDQPLREKSEKFIVGQLRTTYSMCLKMIIHMILIEITYIGEFSALKMLNAN